MSAGQLWPVEIGQQIRPVDARVGDVILSGPRTSGFAEWNRYAAVNDEFVPIHMDDEAGRRAGYPSAIGMGRLQWSYVHVFLREWLAEAGRIREVSLQFRGPALKDAAFEVRATVTGAREESATERTLTLDVEVRDGSEALLAPGSAVVTVATNEERRDS